MNIPNLKMSFTTFALLGSTKRSPRNHSWISVLPFQVNFSQQSVLKRSNKREDRKEKKKAVFQLRYKSILFKFLMIITTLILSSGEMKATSQSRAWDNIIASQCVLTSRCICNFCDVLKEWQQQKYVSKNLRFASKSFLSAAV